MSRAADSAGRPWAGRSFDHHDTAYAGDDGREPDGWSAAVAALAAGERPLAEVVDALRGQRLLVPLLAAAGETGVDERGRTIDKTQELSIVTVQGPDGAPVLPMFASVQAMQAWDARARPVPTSVQRAAAAALDGPARIVVDPGSDAELVLTRTMLEALLVERPWRPAVADPAVHTAIAEALFSAPAVQAVVVATGDPRSRLQGAEVEVHVLVDDEPDARHEQDARHDQVRRAAADLGASELLRERVTSLAVRLHRWAGGRARLPLVAEPAYARTRAEHEAR